MSSATTITKEKTFTSHLLPTSTEKKLFKKNSEIAPVFSEMTGPKAELFHELFRRNIVDEKGFLTSAYKDKSLPLLSEKMIRFLKEIMNAPLIFEAANKQIKTTLAEILYKLQTQAPGAKLESRFTKEFVTYLLFSTEFEYLKTLFTSLDALDLYDQYIQGKIAVEKPKAITISTHVKTKEFNLDAFFTSFLKIFDLNSNFQEQAKKDVCFGKVENPLASFCSMTLSSKESENAFFWMIEKKLPNSFTFTDLSLLFSNIGSSSSFTLSSYSGCGIQSLLDCLLGNIRHSSNTISPKDFFLLNWSYVQGNTSAVENQEQECFQKTEENLPFTCDGKAPEILRSLDKWIFYQTTVKEDINNRQSLTSEQWCFYFSSACTLKKYFPQESHLFKIPPFPLSNASPILLKISELEKKLGIELLRAYLDVFASLIYCKDSTIVLRSCHEFKQCTYQLCVEKQFFIRWESNLLNSLEFLKEKNETDTHAKDLLDLFGLLMEGSILQKKEPLAVFSIGVELCENSSFFMQFLGLSCLLQFSKESPQLTSLFFQLYLSLVINLPDQAKSFLELERSFFFQQVPSLSSIGPVKWGEFLLSNKATFPDWENLVMAFLLRFKDQLDSNVFIDKIHSLISQSPSLAKRLFFFFVKKNQTDFETSFHVVIDGLKILSEKSHLNPAEEDFYDVLKREFLTLINNISDETLTIESAFIAKFFDIILDSAENSQTILMILKRVDLVGKWKEKHSLLLEQVWSEISREEKIELLSSLPSFAFSHLQFTKSFLSLLIPELKEQDGKIQGLVSLATCLLACFEENQDASTLINHELFSILIEKLTFLLEPANCKSLQQAEKVLVSKACELIILSLLEEGDIHSALNFLNKVKSLGLEINHQLKEKQIRLLHLEKLFSVTEINEDWFQKASEALSLFKEEELEKSTYLIQMIEKGFAFQSKKKLYLLPFEELLQLYKDSKSFPQESFLKLINICIKILERFPEPLITFSQQCISNLKEILPYLIESSLPLASQRKQLIILVATRSIPLFFTESLAKTWMTLSLLNEEATKNYNNNRICILYGKKCGLFNFTFLQEGIARLAIQTITPSEKTLTPKSQEMLESIFTFELSGETKEELSLSLINYICQLSPDEKNITLIESIYKWQSKFSFKLAIPFMSIAQSLFPKNYERLADLFSSSLAENLLSEVVKDDKKTDKMLQDLCIPFAKNLLEKAASKTSNKTFASICFETAKKIVFLKTDYFKKSPDIWVSIFQQCLRFQPSSLKLIWDLMPLSSIERQKKLEIWELLLTTLRKSEDYSFLLTSLNQFESDIPAPINNHKELVFVFSLYSKLFENASKLQHNKEGKIIFDTLIEHFKKMQDHNLAEIAFTPVTDIFEANNSKNPRLCYRASSFVTDPKSHELTSVAPIFSITKNCAEFFSFIEKIEVEVFKYFIEEKTIFRKNFNLLESFINLPRTEKGWKLLGELFNNLSTLAPELAKEENQQHTKGFLDCIELLLDRHFVHDLDGLDVPLAIEQLLILSKLATDENKKHTLIHCAINLFINDKTKGMLPDPWATGGDLLDVLFECSLKFSISMARELLCHMSKFTNDTTKSIGLDKVSYYVLRQWEREIKYKLKKETIISEDYEGLYISLIASIPALFQDEDPQKNQHTFDLTANLTAKFFAIFTLSKDDMDTILNEWEETIHNASLTEIEKINFYMGILIKMLQETEITPDIISNYVPDKIEDYWNRRIRFVSNEQIVLKNTILLAIEKIINASNQGTEEGQKRLFITCAANLFMKIFEDKAEGNFHDPRPIAYKLLAALFEYPYEFSNSIIKNLLRKMHVFIKNITEDVELEEISYFVLKHCEFEFDNMRKLNIHAISSDNYQTLLGNILNAIPFLFKEKDKNKSQRNFDLIANLTAKFFSICSVNMQQDTLEVLKAWGITIYTASLPQSEKFKFHTRLLTKLLYELTIISHSIPNYCFDLIEQYWNKLMHSCENEDQIKLLNYYSLKIVELRKKNDEKANRSNKEKA